MNVACNNLTGVPLLVTAQCNKGLTYDPEAGGCAFTCYLPALSDGQYNDAKVMQGVIGWLSWASNLSSSPPPNKTQRGLTFVNPF